MDQKLLNISFSYEPGRTIVEFIATVRINGENVSASGVMKIDQAIGVMNGIQDDLDDLLNLARAQILRKDQE